MQNFNELNLSTPLLKSINELGYTSPTPIQAQTLPILLGEPTDFLGLAATGTGKTAAFAIPMLEKLDPKLKAVQCLILCPTRELALQVAGQVDLLGKHMGIRSVAVYGGASYTDQIRALKNGASVVVGTPGRVVDHIDRGTLTMGHMKVLILDEADEMISMGFADDMEKIMQAIPKDQAKTWLFSATMNQQVSRVAKTYLRNPQQVQVNRTEMLSTTIQQYYYSVRESDKPEILCKLIDSAEDFYGLIFCQTKVLVTDLVQYLLDKGYKVDSLHGDKDQKARETTLLGFRNRKTRILVCTDVASRGIDVKDITHVINYSLPRELDNYVHRIGRTARSGKTGIAMNLVSPAHRSLVFAIERFTKSRMLEGKIPTRREIGAKKVTQMLATFENQPNSARALEILSEEWKTSLAGKTSEQVAAHFIAMLMPDLFNEKARETQQMRTPPPDRPPQQRRDRYESQSRRREGGDGERREFRSGPSRDGGGSRDAGAGGEGFRRGGRPPERRRMRPGSELPPRRSARPT